MTIEELSDIIHSPEQLCPPYIFQQTTKDNQRLPLQAQSCDQSITFHIKSSNHQITNAHQLPSLVPHPSLQITPLPPRRRKLQYRRQTISVRPHIHIRIHALLPAEVGTIDQTPVAVLAGFRVQSDGGGVVANGFDALVVGPLAARPGAFGEPFGGSGGAAGWVLAGAVEAGYRGAHCLVRFWVWWFGVLSFWVGWFVEGWGVREALLL